MAATNRLNFSTVAGIPCTIFHPKVGSCGRKGCTGVQLRVELKDKKMANDPDTLQRLKKIVEMDDSGISPMTREIKRAVTSIFLQKYPFSRI